MTLKRTMTTDQRGPVYDIHFEGKGAPLAGGTSHELSQALAGLGDQGVQRDMK